MNGGEPEPAWSGGGRSLRWRLWMLAGGAVVAGYGVAVIWRPQVLLWSIGGACVLFGLVLAASAVLARGPK